MARADKRNLPATGIDGDRLSSLPGEILSHILSFLETKYAVSTSILSQRWKYLWTRVSILDLVDSLHVPSQEPRDLAFSRFVDRVLSEHMNLNSLRRLRLLFSTNSRPSSSFWCKMELDSNASQLEEIDVRPPRHSGMRGLPQSFYALKNLMVLKLDFVMLTPGDGYVFLPSLKVLQLFSVEITDCESLARLFSGCPVLETLRMKYCYSSISDKNENYVITASLPSLKNLAIIGTGGHDPNLCLIVVDAPSLEHLRLVDFEEFGFWGSSQLPCLVSARIDIRWTHEEHPLMVFLTHISNAKELRLSWRILVINHFLPVSPHYIFPLC
ncbi:unnamed protein product [Linum trigynum]|uniref:F-box domain-containing protein n=1 Tax=Linum trigynum TaxID=586398 RepID=A0AAV2FCW8_9ROSI